MDDCSDLCDLVSIVSVFVTREHIFIPADGPLFGFYFLSRDMKPLRYHPMDKHCIVHLMGEFAMNE